MKKILALVLLLLVPQMGFAYYVWHPCCNSCNRLAGWWADAEGMFLWRKKRFYPPLVTASATAPPILGDPTTRILFGDETIGNSPKAGYRIDAGLWWDCCWGLGGGFYSSGTEKNQFKAGGNALGEPFIGRPFFNAASGNQEVDLISGPTLLPLLNNINGSIEIDTVNRNMGGDAYTRFHLINQCRLKWDVLGGFYYNQLVDNLNITTQQTVISLIALPEVIRVNDQFNCTNNFYGALVGSVAEFCYNRWAIRATCKVGLGSMQKRVQVKGSTTSFTGVDLGTISVQEFGFLANLSNIGKHSHHKFEVIPELQVRLEFRVWKQLRLTAGYTCIYWPSVVLSGEQVNLTLNSAEPSFHHKDKSFWMQGATAGFYVCF